TAITGTDNNLYQLVADVGSRYWRQQGVLYSNITAWRAAPGTPDLAGDIGDPAYIDPTALSPAQDLSITTGSPALGFGDATHPDAPSDDINGNPRTNGNDSGAYQFSG
ncbi:unnamed protein product, partial [marine sediment metagenome]